MAGRLAVGTGPRQHVPGEPSHAPLRPGMPPAKRRPACYAHVRTRAPPPPSLGERMAGWPPAACHQGRAARVGRQLVEAQERPLTSIPSYIIFPPSLPLSPPPQFFYTQGGDPLFYTQGGDPPGQGTGPAAHSRSLSWGNHVPDGTGHERLTGPFPKLEQPPTPHRINVAHIRKFGVAIPD